MPKTRALTKAQRQAQTEEAAGEAFLRKLNMIKAGVDAQTDEDFAEMIGVSYSRYRNIKRNPMSVHLYELIRIIALGATCGMTLHMDGTGLIDARA